ncbi:GL23462 [Drosophila persimilis]|uniref:NAD-dependent protein deacetylase n=1 Tax=Drosophila persimilis TaxID=7234 RepID=B4G3F0_DROPE|nr:NAD-dependent protein deacetylase Sirt2 [Drosophila persimilis]EDW24332.1 GL23462 [Drosophila persimilis]
MSDNDQNDTAAVEIAPKEEDSAESDNSEGSLTVDGISRLLASTLNVGPSSTKEKEKVIADLTFKGLADHWRENGFKKIITMVGAGISTSAGIPDFRSPGSGLYDNLAKYKLPYPTAIFELGYFKKKPAPFFALAKELYPGSFEPTTAHYFIRLLHEKGMLLRHYTQNIDTLDRLAGIPDEKLIEAHGSFHTNHCIGCKKEYDMAWMKKEIFSDRLPTCTNCKKIVKPDIVFFGENLPEKFHNSLDGDFKECDLLIIMGTTLEVHPFASLAQLPGPRCVRLLINRDAVGRPKYTTWMDGHNDDFLLYNRPNNTRDVAFLGDCDEGVLELAKNLGWEDELQDLISTERKLLTEQELVAKQKPHAEEAASTSSPEKTAPQ